MPWGVNVIQAQFDSDRDPIVFADEEYEPGEPWLIVRVHSESFQLITRLSDATGQRPEEILARSLGTTALLERIATSGQRLLLQAERGRAREIILGLGRSLAPAGQSIESVFGPGVTETSPGKRGKKVGRRWF